MLRAVHAVLQPWGVSRGRLDALVLQEWRQGTLQFEKEP